MTKDFHRRHATALLLAAVVCLPAIVWGTIGAYKRTDNSIDQWLPKNCEATDVYYRFRRLFGSDETVLVSWEGCTLGDDRLERFARALEGTGDDAEVFQQSHLIEHVTTGQRVYEQLDSSSFGISEDLALRRLQSVLIGPDQQTTCAVVTLATDSSSERAAAVAAIRRIAVEHCGVPSDDLRLTGDAVISVGIDTEGDRAVSQLMWYSAVLALIVAWLCLRSVKLAILVFVLSQYCQAASEAIVYYTGGSMNLLVVMVPVLVYVLAVSASVHLFNYYRDAVLSYGPIRAPREALRAGWQPCLIAAITTSLGLASLCVSHVMPVKTFGIYGAAGVLISFGVLVLLLPAATVKFPVVPRSRSPIPLRERNPASRKKPGFFAPVADSVIRRPWLVIVPFAVAFAVLAVGLAKIRTSVQPVRFLPPDSRWITDMYWYSQHVGPLASAEIVIGLSDDCGLEFADRMRVVRDVQIRVAQLDRVEGAVSCASFAPKLGPFRGRSAAPGRYVRRFVADRLLLEHRNEFIEGRYLAEDGDWEMWRIEARVSKFTDLDYEAFVQQLDAEIRPVLTAAGIPPGAAHVTYTGGVPLVFAAQQELFDALFVSFTLAVGLVAIVMTLVLRSLSAGLMAMIPNVFPALATFGVMGWMGAVVDVGAMMTASIGLGIAVDDTLHFLTWYRRASRDGASRQEAIRTAYGRCAPAMLHTTLIAGLALFVFFFSSFQPVSQFGLLLFMLLVAALVGDLLLLPALLATRLGDFFRRGTQIKHKTATSPSDECPA
ncbi:MAG: MMPL family transporter [Pirellulaceae bacterium]|nr:MMPL family transporter [Pirellulaceae bacterium]